MRSTSPSLLVALLACLNLGLSVGAHGQQQMVELKFITFPQTQDPLEMELAVSKDKTVLLEIPSNELSQAYRVPRLNTMVFGKSVLDNEGKPKFEIFGKGKMAAGKEQTVLILRKGKSFSEGFDVRTVSSGDNDFGGGDLLFLNATSRPMAGIAGKQKFALKPARHTVVKPIAERDGRLAHVEFYFLDLENKPTNFFSSWWPIGENYRGFIFFYQDTSRDDKITFHSYRDFIDPE